ncbi:metallophosphatase domain-containing protein [Acidicapsa ligni]|uniref:metallophosphatase domain-containing protein n=1 Tax=Acidicapsa ligni TaxID=542300 RepID=UPI0021DF711B|nr:metallophosphatase domain-containing protein [Acidicapsa ligni]
MKRLTDKIREVKPSPSIRLVCLSDTHGLHRRFEMPPADILIHAGDFMTSGRDKTEIADFDDWLQSLPYRRKIVIAGNHDILFEADPKGARATLRHADYLENSEMTVEGLRFWGSPVTPVTGQWAFAAERGASIRRCWRKIPAEIDVLITHGPPFGTLDKADILAPHLGCKDLIEAVIRTQPRLHIFGHVHGGRGEETNRSGIRFVNCAVLDEWYKLAHQPIVVEIA